MTVFLGNYNIPTDAGEAYERQRDTIKEALETYGTDHVAGITVGNEFMLKCVCPFFFQLLIFLYSFLIPIAGSIRKASMRPL